MENLMREYYHYFIVAALFWVYVYCVLFGIFGKMSMLKRMVVQYGLLLLVLVSSSIILYQDGIRKDLLNARVGESVNIPCVQFQNESAFTNFKESGLIEQGTLISTRNKDDCENSKLMANLYP